MQAVSAASTEHAFRRAMMGIVNAQGRQRVDYSQNSYEQSPAARSKSDLPVLHCGVIVLSNARIDSDAWLLDQRWQEAAMRLKRYFSVMHVLGRAGKSAFVLALASIVLEACVFMPKVRTPDPTHPNLETESEAEAFEGFSPDEVLAAAEDVLEAYAPPTVWQTISRKIVRDKSAIVMQYHAVLFIGFAFGEVKEKWVVTAQPTKSGALAIAAFGKASVGSGYLVLAAPSEWISYPDSYHHINYRLFWGSVRCRLNEGPCPECKELDSAEIMWGGVFWYEPMCGRFAYTPRKANDRPR